jgi:hypothetical protein
MSAPAAWTTKTNNRIAAGNFRATGGNFRVPAMWEPVREQALCHDMNRNRLSRTDGTTMKLQQAEDVIVHNLIDALSQLHSDLDRIELWTAALDCFQRPAPDYQASDDYLLPSHKDARR